MWGGERYLCAVAGFRLDGKQMPNQRRKSLSLCTDTINENDKWVTVRKDNKNIS